MEIEYWQSLTLQRNFKPCRVIHFCSKCLALQANQVAQWTTRLRLKQIQVISEVQYKNFAVVLNMLQKSFKENQYAQNGTRSYIRR